LVFSTDKSSYNSYTPEQQTAGQSVSWQNLVENQANPGSAETPHKQAVSSHTSFYMQN